MPQELVETWKIDRTHPFDIAGERVVGSARFLEGFGVDASQYSRALKPADLPIVPRTALELVINRKTAKALGVTCRQRR